MIELFASSVVILLVLYALGWVIAIVGVMLFGVVVMVWTVFCALVTLLLSPLMPSGWDFQSALKRWWDRHGNKVSTALGVVVIVPGVAMGIFGLWIAFVGDPFPSWHPGRARQEANSTTATTTPAIRETGEQKSVEPDASSGRPLVPEPPVNITMTERQIELLRQDVAGVAPYETLSRLKGIPSYLSECSGNRISDWKAGALARNREGLFMLGLFCVVTEQSDDVKRDGVVMLKAASAGGVREADYWLGMTYFSGIGVSEDSIEASKWFRKAAEQGHTYAKYIMFILCAGDDFGIMDNGKAMAWLTEAAEQGLADAQCILGTCYKNGKSVAMDKKAAAKWYLLAAEQGLARAQYSLGLLYGDGTLVIYDPDRSMGWLARAAQQGMPEAQREFDRRLREDERVAIRNNGKLPVGFTRIELGSDGKVRVGR